MAGNYVYKTIGINKETYRAETLKTRIPKEWNVGNERYIDTAIFGEYRSRYALHYLPNYSSTSTLFSLNVWGQHGWNS